MNQLPLPSRLINEFEILAKEAEIEDWEHPTWHDGRPTIRSIASKLVTYFQENYCTEMAKAEIIKYLMDQHYITLQAATDIVDQVTKAAGMIQYLDTDENQPYYMLPTRYQFSILPPNSEEEA